MTNKPPLRVYLVDDESLALKRLTRLLMQTRRVEIVGSTAIARRSIALRWKHSR